MLVKFSVGNYLSFKNITHFDMSSEALKDKKGFIHVPYLHNQKISLLKSAVIYGYNAFGKSNLIKAYSTYRDFILKSFSFGLNNSNLKAIPFKLNTSTTTKPSFFEAIFIIGSTKYRLGFEAFEDKIVSEWLFYADGPVRENVLYLRYGQEFKEISKLWNKNSQNKVEHAKMFTKPDSLFLSVMASQDNVPRIAEITSWFKGNLILNGDYNSNIHLGADRIYTSEDYRSIILKFLDNADLGFTSVFEKVSNQVAKGHLHVDLIDLIFDLGKTNFDLYTHHKVFDEEYSFKKIIELDLLKDESSGSIKYFIVACYLAYTLKKGQLIWIDELDSSLHTQLLIFLIETFNSEKNNINGSQLIFTAHNTVLLDKKLRRDQIWFIHKNEYGESTLHRGHSSETPIRVNKSIEQDYREGELKKGKSSKATKNNLPSLFD